MLAAWGHRSVLAWRSLLIKNNPKPINVFVFLFWWSLKGRSDLCWISAFLCAMVVVLDPAAVKKNFLYHCAGSFLCAAWFPGMLLAWKHSPTGPRHCWQEKSDSRSVWLSQNLCCRQPPMKEGAWSSPSKNLSQSLQPHIPQCGEDKEGKGQTTPDTVGKECQKEHHSWPDKGTKTRTRTQGQQRLAPPGVLCWESLHHVPLAKDAARYLLSPKSLPQPWSQSFWERANAGPPGSSLAYLPSQGCISDPLFTESYFPKMSLYIQYPVMRTRATCCFGNASA